MCMQICDFLVDKLKQINGGTITGFYPSYTFQTNIWNNSIRGFRFLDEVNDFPYLMSTCMRIDYTHSKGGIIYKTHQIHIRGYVFNEEGETLNQMEDLVEDIEHVVNNLHKTPNDLCIQESRIDTIQTDEGLMAPFGVLDINLRIITEE